VIQRQRAAAEDRPDRERALCPFHPARLALDRQRGATLMFSFVGWEAVAPLTTRFADLAGSCRA
jgi:hypothetical protein